MVGTSFMKKRLSQPVRWTNLIDWDPWVEALKDRYRVVRFDMTSHGLTGPDPSGDYTLPRTLALTEKFMDAVKAGTNIVVLEGFTTTSKSSRTIITNLNALHRRFKDQGVAVVGISDEAPEKIKETNISNVRKNMMKKPTGSDA